MFVKSINPINNNTAFQVEFYSELPEGEQTISVSNDLEDYAGYSVVSTELTVDVVPDEEAPEVVSVEKASPTKATLVFNEDIDFVDQSNPEDYFYHTNSGQKATDAEIVDGNKVELTFDPSDSLPNGTAYIYVDGEAVEDLWGNENEQTIRVTAEVEVDEVAPEVEAVEAVGQGQLKVTYSEEVSDSALDTDNYTLLDSDGDENDIVDDITWATDDEGNQVEDAVILNLDSNVYGDNSLVINDVEDLAGNATSETQLDFFAEDTTRPEFNDFSATLYNDGAADEMETLIINFGEPMAVEGKYSILDLEKYVVNNVPLSDVSGVKATAVDNNSKLRLDLKDDATYDNGTAYSFSDGENEIELARVADAADNYTPLLQGTIDIDTEGSVDADSVSATSHNEIVVTLTDKVTDFNVDDFVLETTGGTNLGESDADVVTGVNVETVDGVSEITFSLADNTLNDDGEYAESGDQVRVKTATNVETVNQFGEEVSFNELASDAIAPSLDTASYDVDGDGNTEDVADVSADQGVVTLTFTENIDENTVSALTFNVEDQTVESVNVTGTSGATNVVELNLKDSTALVSVGTDVEQVQPIKDTEGNSVTDISAEVGYSEDTTAPEITNASSHDLNNDGVVETLALTFSEDVDDDTLDTAQFNNYTVTGQQADLTLTDAGINDTEDDNTLYLSVSNPTNTNETTDVDVNASAIEDLVGIPNAAETQTVADEASPLASGFTFAADGGAASEETVTINLSEALYDNTNDTELADTADVSSAITVTDASGTDLTGFTAEYQQDLGSGSPGIVITTSADGELTVDGTVTVDSSLEDDAENSVYPNDAQDLN